MLSVPYLNHSTALHLSGRGSRKPLPSGTDWFASSTRLRMP